MGAASSKKNASLPQEQSINDVPHGESLGCARQRMAAGQKSAKSRFEMTGALRKSCPLISIYRDTRGVDHVHLRPCARSQRANQKRRASYYCLGRRAAANAASLLSKTGLKYVKSGMLRRLYDLLD